MGELEKQLSTEWDNLYYSADEVSAVEPEGLPLEAPAGNQTVTPAEFAMDIGNFAKGAVTGAMGLVGDTISIGRGLYEIGRRGGDEDALDAFLRGMEAQTIAPTTEDINKWIDENVGLPERMKTSKPEGMPDVMVRGVIDPQAEGPINREGTAAPYIGTVTSALGEVVGPGAAVIKAAKTASKGVKGSKKTIKPLASVAAAATMDKEQKAK